VKGKVIFFVFLFIFLTGSLFSQTPAQAGEAAREALLRLEAALGGNNQTSVSGSANTTAAQVIQGGTQPAWVNDPYTAYNRDRYIAVIGSGTNRIQAEARALTALAAIFGQSIKSEFVIAAMYTEAVNRGAVSVSDNTSIRDTITKAVSMDNIIGAQIGYVWDSGRDIVYAAAYLDKARAIAVYTDMIIINNNNIAHLTNMSINERNTFDGYARYRLAYQIAGINSNYAVIITMSGGSVASLNLNGADYYKIEAADIFRNITVTVSVDNDRANRVQNAFAGVLSSEGLRTRGNNPPYVLEVSVFSGEVDDPTNIYKWCLMEISANLIENSTGASLLPFSIDLYSGDLSYANAETAAYMNAEREIAQKYPALLREYLAAVMPD